MIGKIAALHIGQGTRPDLLEELTDRSSHLEVIHAGALDGVSLTEITRDTYQVPLLVRSGDAGPVLAERDYIRDRLQVLIDSLSSQVDAFAVLCAEDFRALRSAKPLFSLYGVGAALLGEIGVPRPIGAICPVEGQMESSRSKWERAGLEAMVRAAAPGDEEAVWEALQDLSGEGARSIILDCAGFGGREAQALSRKSGLWVISLRSLMWSLVSELARD